MPVSKNLSATEAEALILEKENQGFTERAIETELPVRDEPYVATSLGTYKVIDYVNKSGKGLLTLVECTIEHDSKTIEIDIPIGKKKVGMFNAKQEIEFFVTKKDNDPKRIKFIGAKDEAVVNP